MRCGLPSKTFISAERFEIHFDVYFDLKERILLYPKGGKALGSKLHNDVRGVKIFLEKLRLMPSRGM